MFGNRTTQELKRIERKHEQLDEIRTRLQLGPTVRSDFPDIPHRTFYTRMRELVNSNQAKTVGRGKYVSMEYDPLVGQIVGYLEEVAYKLPAALMPKQGVLKWSASRTTLKRLAKLHGRSPDNRQFIDCYWKAYHLFRIRFDPKRSWTKSDAELRQVKEKEEEHRRRIEDRPEQVDQEEQHRYRREMREWIHNGRRGPPPIFPLDIEASSMKISKAHKLPLPLDLLEEA